MARNIRFDVGTFVAIPLGDGQFGYARVVAKVTMAFYDLKTLGMSTDLDAIEQAPVVFVLSVRVLNPAWTDLGIRPLSGSAAQPYAFFMQATGNYKKCTIYDSRGGERSATPEECVGLERSAVWDSHGVEERLRDHFAGRPNEEAEYQRVLFSNP